MSKLLDTIEMLEKRAAGESPASSTSDREVRLLAIELEKQAFIGRALAGLAGLPARAGSLTGSAIKATGLPRAAGSAAGGAAGLGARLVSETAALPFDHPGKLLSIGMPLGFSALDLASRTSNLKRLGQVAKPQVMPNIHAGRLG